MDTRSSSNREAIERDTVNGGASDAWWPGVRGRVGWYVVAAALFTAILINYSLRHGRLAVGPTDDDAVYFVDALQRLDILHRGFKPFLHNLIQFPPHSPFATALAMLSFAVFGTHQWAPYAGN